MKDESKYCILSVRYSIMECNGEKEELQNTTQMEHVFTARKKSTLLKKIQRFEDRLRTKQPEVKRNLLNRISHYITRFMERYRYNYQSLLRM